MEKPAPQTEPAALPSPWITISLCGDVMTGRGIDQILHHPGDSALHEPFVHDAGEYVRLAEQAHGPIPRAVENEYVWGDALEEWDQVAPDVRIANLETSVTTSSDYWLGKDVHYRMNPQNVGCLAAARFGCCALANNHVLDGGRGGLAETLQTLQAAGLKWAGAGIDRNQAAAPAVLELPAKGRVIFFSFGSVTSGIPYSWAATDDRPGVNLLADMSASEVRRIQREVAQVKRHNDIVVASIHWGPNWGYDIPEPYRVFAHQLTDTAGIDVIHGHSSHHVLGIEVYRGHLILYGCGDFLDDYEGIHGHEAYRGDLGLIYFAGIEPTAGRLSQLRMTPARVRRMRVERASDEDARWISDVLNRESRKYGVHVESAEDGRLKLEWNRVPE